LCENRFVAHKGNASCGKKYSESKKRRIGKRQIPLEIWKDYDSLQISRASRKNKNSPKAQG
jgi:hypothetical protein